MTDYSAVERFVVGGGVLPNVETLEEKPYNGQNPVWATNQIGEVVKYDPTKKVYSFPTGSTDTAELIAA